MKRKLIAGLAGLALLASTLVASAPVSAAPGSNCNGLCKSAAVAQPGDSITDPSGKVVKAGKTSAGNTSAPKGNARPGVKSEKAKGLLALTYFYNTAYQYPGGAGSGGIQADHGVVKPYLDTTAGDFHSLEQIWAQSADGQQAVETGWVVSQNINGDLLPHLFVGARKNGVFQGWNSKFTAVAGAAYTAGQSIDGDRPTVKRFQAQFFDGVWWVSYNSVWYGYFNPSTTGLWAASPAVTFNTVGLGQTGGEVAANSSTPCTDMGNGFFGKVAGAPNTPASRSWNWSLLAPPVGVPSSLTLNASTNSAYYDHILNTGSVRSFYLGGPGAC